MIVVSTPKNNNLNSAWGSYRTTMDAIEAASGLGIFSALLVSVRNM